MALPASVLKRSPIGNTANKGEANLSFIRRRSLLHSSCNLPGPYPEEKGERDRASVWKQDRARGILRPPPGFLLPVALLPLAPERVGELSVAMEEHHLQPRHDVKRNGFADIRQAQVDG